MCRNGDADPHPSNNFVDLQTSEIDHFAQRRHCENIDITLGVRWKMKRENSTAEFPMNERSTLNGEHNIIFLISVINVKEQKHL